MLIKQSIQTKNLEPALTMTSSLQAGELAETLHTILREMQHINNRKTFAACHTCRFNEHHTKGSICGLTKEPLSVRDVHLICREDQ